MEGGRSFGWSQERNHWRMGGASVGHKKGIIGGKQGIRLVTNKELLEGGSFSWSQTRNQWRIAGA
jgi:hypothetical protein